MRLADLNLHELLHTSPEGGILRFANERVLLLDAVAMACCGASSLRALACRVPARS